MAFGVGQTVGDYQVIEVLGTGGMGTVYKVRHLISDRLEAVKLVLPQMTENPELADRFMREIKLQAQLNHPNIASLHNALRVDNQLLMVMELIEGRTLNSVLRQGAMALITAVDITVQILSALEYAHSKGVIHRDIKPGNVMLTGANGVKLMDFGIARSLAEDRRLTRTGAAVGSVYYMSPEQVQDAPADERADLYSVGVLLYEMTTGSRPVYGDSSWAVMSEHVNTIPRSPSVVNSQIPEALSLAILKALEKDKAHRFQSAEVFSESLMAVRSRMRGVEPKLPTAVQKVASFQETALATPSHGAASLISPPVAIASTPLPPLATTVRFDPERLEKLTRELASFVGPMAKLLVSRAAKKARTWNQLYDALAPEVPDGAERRQFLSRRP